MKLTKSESDILYIICHNLIGYVKRSESNDIREWDSLKRLMDSLNKTDSPKIGTSARHYVKLRLNYMMGIKEYEDEHKEIEKILRKLI